MKEEGGTLIDAQLFFRALGLPRSLINSELLGNEAGLLLTQDAFQLRHLLCLSPSQSSSATGMLPTAEGGTRGIF